MSRIVLIGCGKEKAAEPCAAAELYTGPLFRDRLAYARAAGAPTWIVSALYGLVDLQQLVRPYDRNITDMSPVDRAAWCLAVTAGLLDQLEDNAELREVGVELHMGAEYAEQLRDVLIAAGLSVSWPVRGLGIGDQRAWYARHTRLAQLGAAGV